MSEYQYYEFSAIDKPLTKAQMAELRERSTRATITPNSFTNHYEWGSLKGDPADWMRRYFDAHVYVANWCTCWLFLKLPKNALDVRTIRDFTTQDALTVDHAKEHLVLQWAVSESEDYDRFTEDDGSGWMARLLPLRDELLRGDLRSLYLGWLAGVTVGEVEDDDTEPPPPPGLSRLTGAQQSLVEFLEINADLVTAAGATDEQAPSEDTNGDPGSDAWLARLPEVEKMAVLKLLLSGQGQQAERQLKSAFLSWQRTRRPAAEADALRRTVAELRKLANAAAAVRLQQEAAQRMKAEAERKAKREVHLRKMAGNFDRLWRDADAQAQRGVASGHDSVRRTITDLADAYTFCAKRADFDRTLAKFMLQHGKRKALVQRLMKAGLWEKTK